MSPTSLAIIAALLWGAAALFDKLGLRAISPGLGFSVRSLVIGGVMLVVFLASGQTKQIADAKPLAIVYMVLSAVCAGLVGQFLYFAALKRGEASTIVPIAGSYPLVAAILGIIVLSEELTWFKALGAILVVSGVVLLKWQR